MLVKKFNTLEQAREDLWCFEPDAEYYRMVAEHWILASKLYEKKCPRGIFKYRTVKEANDDG
ncbi:MAG: hypothetical protein JRJ09_05585 [Deltaproteobacteria bacterium]|nr:hypothetical protein [Deltaproteobacteria bacterium]MBW2047987.1 hypothetical protein [Deltaproteobacteria bacterium]MBW2112982.1 hypothetical protein [Deltaproteobacteria bacterium]MBW2353943.1 hypothetical protein [Deltaproteobacteria bacterium]HDZ90638.1 hypothetical protein [Deltaproteobacteria bacterium]